MPYEELIMHYGYWALAVGIMVEGETVLILSGFTAHQQYMNLLLVILIAFVCSLIIDQSFFLMGRYKAETMLKKYPSWRPYLEKVRKILIRHPDALAVGFRFLYGFRMMTPFAIGYLGSMNYRRFLPLNAIGALAWSVVFACAGFLFGRTLELFFEDIKRYEHWVMIALIFLGALAWLAFHYRREKAFSG